MTEDKKDFQAPNLGQPFAPQQRKPIPPATLSSQTKPPSQTPRAGSVRPGAASDDDALEIASPGASLASSVSASPPAPGTATTKQVGTPMHPQTAKKPAVKAVQDTPSLKPQAPQQSAPPPASPHLVNPGALQKPKAAAQTVSPQQAQEISSKLKAGNPGLPDKSSSSPRHARGSGETPAAETKKTMFGVNGFSEDIPSTGSSLVQTASTGPLHGVAIFNGPVITLMAPEPLTSGDEIIVRNHRYQLKAGKAPSKGSTFLLAAALTVAGFLAGQYLAGDQASAGLSIVGVALNEKGAPTSSGAVVRLPELGLTTYTDENGFFSFENVPTGTFKIEYTLSGSSHGGQASVSVSEGDASLLTLVDSGKKVVSSRKKKASRKSASSSKKSSSSQASTSGRALSEGIGSLAVTSQTSGAKVYLDGQSLGAVNKTFRRIRAGKRTIRIEKSGYKTSTVMVKVNPGKIARLDIDLEPLASKQKSASSASTGLSSSAALSAAELYETGRELFKAGDLNQADKRFDQALAKKPSMADAYFMKAEIADKQGNGKNAFKHYLKAGEIWLGQRRYGNALAALDNAVEQNPDNPLGYKVRGDAYRARGHSTIAIHDYEEALDIDNKFYAARLALGIVLLEKGSSRKAKKELRRAKDVNDQDPILYHYLMLASLARNDRNDVNNYFEQFRDIASDADMKRFYGSAKLAEVREVIKD